MDALRIDRINELYHKPQAVGLIGEEKKEQVWPRQEYVTTIQGSLCDNLNGVSVKEPDGSTTNSGKKYGGIREV